MCNATALENRTQRVRKAAKKGCILVDVEWVRRCGEEGRRVEVEGYERNLAEKEVVTVAVEEDGGEGEEIDPDAGWSEPIALGCCCVCHDTGRDCEWCLDCDVTRARKARIGSDAG